VESPAKGISVLDATIIFIAIMTCKSRKLERDVDMDEYAAKLRRGLIVIAVVVLYVYISTKEFEPACVFIDGQNSATQGCVDSSQIRAGLITVLAVVVLSVFISEILGFGVKLDEVVQLKGKVVDLDARAMCVSASVGDVDLLACAVNNKEPWSRKPAAKIWGKKRIKAIDLTLAEQLVRTAKRPGKRAAMSKILLEKGTISRKNVLKIDKWGDIRFLKLYTDEFYHNGVFMYTLKQAIKADLKGLIKKG